MKKIFEVLFLLVGAAVSMYFMMPEDAPPAPPPRTATASGAGVRQAPPFEARDVNGQDFAFDGHGPAFINLTATGCGGCVDRIHKADEEAVSMARSKKLQVVNLLVYSSYEAGVSFAQQHHPAADVVVPDPGGKIGVQTYRGSDAACWILIDKEGTITWQGPADPAKLEVALEGY